MHSIPRFILLALLLAVPQLTNADSTPEVQTTRSDFQKLIDRPRVPLDAQITPLPSAPDFSEFHFTFATDAAQRVPGILIKRTHNDSHRQPVVISLHGTGGTKSDELPLLRALAAKGFIAVAIDGRYHGERSKAGKGTADYDAAIFLAWRDGHHHPFYYDTVWDISRLIDYLQTRDDIDPARIGLIGFSKGGIETYLAAAADPRIAVAIPCIGLESFQWALQNNDWQARIGTIQPAFDSAAKEAGITTPTTDFVRQFYSRVVPGIDSEFDGPALVKLIAPRPLMAINGDSDPHTPLPGLQLCIDSARAAYHAASADDHFVIRIEPKTAHKVNHDSMSAAMDWFTQWLHP